MAYDMRPTYPDGMEHDDSWVAWGHADTKTRTKARGGHGSHGRKRRPSGGGGHRRHRHQKHTGRKVAIVVAIVAVVLIAFTVLFGFSAYGAMQDGKKLMAQVDTFQESLTSGDAAAVQSSASDIQATASSLKGTVDGPLWVAAGVLPVVGTDISNVRTLGTAVDDLATSALVPLSEQAGNFDMGQLIGDGSFDVDTISGLGSAIVQVAPAVERATTSIDALPKGSIAQVNEVVDEARTQLDGLNALCKGLSELAPYLPDMLGANGERTYLILAHNTSELKPSGGFIGSVGTVTFDDGKMELGDFGSFWPASPSHNGHARAYVTDEEAELFSSTYGNNAGDNGANPDFSREGQMSKEMWEGQYGGTVDGAIGLDSQVLQDFLGLVGGVTMQDGTVVDGTNAVQVLGHDVYWRYFTKEPELEGGNDAADAYFAEVAQLAFDKMLADIGNVSLTGLADVLGGNAAGHRLMVWMNDADEERALENLGVSGKISADEEHPQIGLFIESRRASKLDWWQTCDVDYSRVSQNADGSTTYAVMATFTNALTPDEVAQAGRYILGKDNGMIADDVFLYAPAGGTVSDVQASTGTQGKVFPLEGNQVAKIRVTVDPGTSTTLTYKVTTSPKAVSEPTVRMTPMAHFGA